MDSGFYGNSSKTSDTSSAYTDYDRYKVINQGAEEPWVQLTYEGYIYKRNNETWIILTIKWDKISDTRLIIMIVATKQNDAIYVSSHIIT